MPFSQTITEGVIFLNIPAGIQIHLNPNKLADLQAWKKNRFQGHFTLAFTQWLRPRHINSTPTLQPPNYKYQHIIFLQEITQASPCHSYRLSVSSPLRCCGCQVKHLIAPPAPHLCVTWGCSLSDWITNITGQIHLTLSRILDKSELNSACPIFLQIVCQEYRTNPSKKLQIWICTRDSNSN